MGQEIRFGVQTFVKDRRGRKAQGRLVPFKTADEARRYAEQCVERQAAIGAAAFSQRAAGEFDEGDEPITLAAFGDVPPEARDRLPF